ncbi:MAG TPA: PBP1A family penicillin-binding protein [Thermoleophilia bacterium]|nr:PBP1A family penicillin-binding protein [Thermoleophilia bacterium]
MIGETRHPPRHRPRWPYLLLGAFFLVAFSLALLAALVGVGATVVRSLTRDLPPVSAVEHLNLPQTSFVYDRHGHLIATIHGATNRIVVGSGQIPRRLRQATVAIEDKRFYRHHGVDFEAILRALVADLSAGHIVEGGSTLTQQYVKDTLLTRRQTFRRKFQEAVLAWRLEDEWSKRTILTHYLNTVYYGAGAYGAQSAALTYFGVPARRLTLAQSATLAGITRLPESYSPTIHPKAARARRNLVLRMMHEQGYISARQMRKAQHKRLGVRRRPPPQVERAAAYFVEYVKQQLIDRYGVRRVFEGGLRVYTTLDLGWQRKAIESIRATLNVPGDPAAALVSVDPSDGAIRAMVGGLDFERQKFDLAWQSRRQPGSAMKPFVLTAAIEQGMNPATTTYVSHPLHLYMGPGAPTWDVTTFDGTSYGTSTVEQATLRSDNTVYAQLVMDVGPRNVVRVARAMGITSHLQAVPSIALGSQVVNPLEMAQAYATFATEGVRHDAYAVRRVESADGRIDYVRHLRGRRVLRPEVAYAVDRILEENVQMGTGVAARLPGRAVAGKTGTTSGFTDAWFCGFTPNLTTVVWVGYPKDTSRSMTSVHGIEVVGGTFPAIIWQRFMQAATAGTPVWAFPVPAAQPQYAVWHSRFPSRIVAAPSPTPAGSASPAGAATRTPQAAPSPGGATAPPVAPAPSPTLTP